jgi:hypothetical protein
MNYPVSHINNIPVITRITGGRIAIITTTL